MSLVTRKIKIKGTEEEQEYYILQWAEDVENMQTKQMDKQEV